MYVKNDVQNIFRLNSLNNNLLLGYGEENDEDINSFEEVKTHNKTAKKLEKEILRALYLIS